MGKKLLFLAVCMMIILAGCASAPPETTPPATTVPVTTEPPAPTTTAPVETTVPVETTEATTAPTEPEPEPVAERIAEGVRIFIGEGDYTGILSDRDHLTKKYFQAALAVTVESQTPFSSLYIEWEEIPGVYTISWEGGSMEAGTHDFLHEYVRLPEEVNKVTIQVHVEKQHTLCDLLVLTRGTAPEGVQDWLPPLEQADILVFPTHADDDVLFFGPLMVYYVMEEELDVQTAFMVEHNYYPHRRHERLNGLWAMGIRHYPILGSAPDTDSLDINFGLAYYSNSNIERWQVEQIRRFEPLVVVGHDLNGEYGNAGHKVNAYYLVRAVESAADPEKYPDLAEQYGLWETPKLYLHLYRENEMIFDVNVVLESDPQGRTPFEIAAQAMFCHQSQLKWGYRVQQGEYRMYDCRPFGLYRSLVGLDTTADIMENINPEDWRGGQ